MGIKGLTALINDIAPKAIDQSDIKTLFGRKVAIDASMSIYQFLIAVRQQDGQQLMNEAGETTSHLMGLFYRTIRMVENGIKPAYVFDGKPPQMKAGVLAKRLERRTEAKEEGEEAKETGTVEELDKLSRRTVKVTKEHNEECRKLLTLMGIPWVVAPSEAEAQCAELCRGGLVYGAGSEDMDTLTFGSPVLLRHLTFSEARKLPIHTVNLEKVLTGLELTMDQFIEFCILCGCDYVDPLRGIAAKTALKLIKEFDTLENVINHLRDKESSKASSSSAKSIPDDWPWEEAKELFKKPDVLKADEVKLEWKKPDLDGLIEFLVKQKGFEEERIKKGVMKLESGFNKKQQSRLDGFFVKDNQNNAEDNSKKSNKNKKTSGKDSNNKKRKA
ncbi:PIN domain-like protein [Phakopsora pachyrhizi]|uniref:Flap endonuclease 1 n=1 Tax=Phakopsora pachyrhizi TaxID=170000 RepID=A0AAV0AGR9_PHAPC|nr:PIN domain-like protein [Phakopsora pachyrhizi]CAH7667514.1 PIN domain-like protein [Phakopsora pachyrhizi]